MWTSNSGQRSSGFVHFGARDKERNLTPGSTPSHRVPLESGFGPGRSNDVNLAGWVGSRLRVRQVASLFSIAFARRFGQPRAFGFAAGRHDAGLQNCTGKTGVGPPQVQTCGGLSVFHGRPGEHLRVPPFLRPRSPAAQPSGGTIARSCGTPR